MWTAKRGLWKFLAVSQSYEHCQNWGAEHTSWKYIPRFNLFKWQRAGRFNVRRGWNFSARGSSDSWWHRARVRARQSAYRIRHAHSWARANSRCWRKVGYLKMIDVSLLNFFCIELWYFTAYKRRSNTVSVHSVLHRLYFFLPLQGESALIWSWLDSMLNHIKSESVSDLKVGNTQDVTR